MFDLKCVMFLCLSLFILGTNAGVVSYIEPCHWNDADCILKSSLKVFPQLISGDPELGIPSMDPLVVDNVKGDSGELKLKFKDLTVKELSKCKIIKVERPEKLKISLQVECPFDATGNYELDGKFTVIPVNGNGNFKITTKKIRIKADITLQLEGEFYKILSSDYSYEPIEKVHINLENLYDGDEAKAEPIKKILDENWKEMVSEVGKPILTEVITHVIRNIAKLIHKTPSKLLELE